MPPTLNLSLTKCSNKKPYSKFVLVSQQSDMNSDEQQHSYVLKHSWKVCLQKGELGSIGEWEWRWILNRVVRI